MNALKVAEALDRGTVEARLKALELHAATASACNKILFERLERTEGIVGVEKEHVRSLEATILDYLDRIEKLERRVKR